MQNTVTQSVIKPTASRDAKIDKLHYSHKKNMEGNLAIFRKNNYNLILKNICISNRKLDLEKRYDELLSLKIDLQVVIDESNAIEI